MTETSPPSTTGYEAAAPVQAMVVGASDVVAGLVGGILERDPRIEIAATPADGAEAVIQFRKGGDRGRGPGHRRRAEGIPDVDFPANTSLQKESSMSPIP